MDPYAVRAYTMFGEDVAYVEAHVAAKIAPLMDCGAVLMACVRSAAVTHPRFPPIARIWRELSSHQ